MRAPEGLRGRLEARLAAAASRDPTKPALKIVGGESITFGELVDQVDVVARSLVAMGVQPGDRVGMLSGHDIRALVLFWATLRAGGVVVWLNDTVKREALSQALESAEPALIAVQGDVQRQKVEELGRFHRRVWSLEELSGAGSPRTTLPPRLAESDPATIIYTSGSSGQPKGVCLSHRNLATVADAVIEHMPISAQDSYLMVVPLHYVHGIMQLLVHALAGATVCFQESFAFPKTVVDAMRATRVTGFSGVPFHFSSLIDRGGLLEADLSDLRWMTVTGGKLAGSTITQILDRFPDVAFHVAYGQTECAPRATALRPERTRRKLDSVGGPIPGVTVLILDDEGAPVPPGGVGEVVIQGDNVMLGYWRDPAATSEAIDDRGRLHTGDLGRFDSEGDLFLVGRKSAMIKSAGERIIPEEIERVLVRHPAVSDAVVVGVDDAVLGQRVVAHLELVDESEERGAEGEVLAAVRDYCRQHFAAARTPREFHVWVAFPRQPNGKPDRASLQSGLSQRG